MEPILRPGKLRHADHKSDDNPDDAQQTPTTARRGSCSGWLHVAPGPASVVFRAKRARQRRWVCRRAKSPTPSRQTRIAAEAEVETKPAASRASYAPSTSRTCQRKAGTSPQLSAGQSPDFLRVKAFSRQDRRNRYRVRQGRTRRRHHRSFRTRSNRST
jgi:hypothetical protein